MAALLDIYLLSTGVGFVYIVGSAMMGGLGSHGHGASGGHGGAGRSTTGGGHATGGHSSGSSGHAAGGHSPGQSGAPAHDMGHSGSHGGSSGHSGGQASHGSNAGHSGGQSTSESANSAQEIAPVLTQSVPGGTRSRDSSDLFLQILDIFNPTKLALFTFLFGAIGVVSIKFIGVISLAPALILGWVLANVFFNLMGSILMRMHSSTNFSKQSLVGAIGELSISIPPGSTGEVVIATGSSRYSSAAKSSDPNQTIKKLAKVIIVDIKDGMFFVEPFDDNDI